MLKLGSTLLESIQRRCSTMIHCMNIWISEEYLNPIFFLHNLRGKIIWISILYFIKSRISYLFNGFVLSGSGFIFRDKLQEYNCKNIMKPFLEGPPQIHFSQNLIILYILNSSFLMRLFLPATLINLSIEDSRIWNF